MNDIERILDIIEEECSLCGSLLRCLTCKVYTLKSFIIDVNIATNSTNDKLNSILRYLQMNYCGKCSTENCNTEIEIFYNCLIKSIAHEILRIKKEGEG